MIIVTLLRRVIFLEGTKMGGAGIGETKWVRHVLGVCLVLIMLSPICTGGCALAQEREPILCLVNGRIPPISYIENGIAKGVVVDIVQAIGEKIERPIEVRAMDWPEAQAQVLAGDADVLLHINRNEDRERNLSFSRPLLPSEFVILRRNGNPEIQQLVDLAGKRVGVEPGGHAHSLLKESDSIETVFTLSPAEGLRLLKTGDVDALVMDRWIGEYELAKSGISGVQIARDPLEKSSTHMAVRKGNAELLALIDRGLEEIANDGTLDQILNDWRGKNVVYMTQEQITRVITGTVAALLLVLLSIALYFIVKLRRLNRVLDARVAQRTKELAMANERLRKANMALEEMPTLDPLTQTLNRRGFDQFLQKAWRVCRRMQLPLALIMIDVDGLKAVNDSHGHLSGDQHLREVGRLLNNATTRSTDAVARIGGDEFACVLFDTAEDGAFAVAEAARRQMAETKIVEGANVDFSASFGVASLIPDPDMVSNELIALADRALYKAKASGRNKVVRASEL